MKTCIGILSYGSGNIESLIQSLNIISIDYEIIDNLSKINKSTHLILPGVGLFDNCIHNLSKSFDIEILKEVIVNGNRPVLGICIGMHLLAEKSEEGNEQGLNIIPGSVRKLENKGIIKSLPLPHMGWNNIDLCIEESKNTLKLRSDRYFYFIHSYRYVLKDKKHEYAKTNYGSLFTSIVSKDNIFGVQFHPEKSHKSGIELLSNFSTLKC